ncbi:hypothetical protein ACWIGW_45955 [Nocardia brasiliensis]
MVDPATCGVRGIVAAFLLIFLHRRYRENEKLYPGGRRPAPLPDGESVS